MSLYAYHSASQLLEAVTLIELPVSTLYETASVCESWFALDSQTRHQAVRRFEWSVVYDLCEDG